MTKLCSFILSKKVLKPCDQVRVFTVYSMDALMASCVEGCDTVYSLGAEIIMLVCPALVQNQDQYLMVICFKNQIYGISTFSGQFIMFTYKL